MNQFTSPVFWTMIVISVLLSSLVLSLMPNRTETETHCVLTSNDLDQLRSNTPLRQIVSRFEEGYYADMRSGQLFDARSGATELIDEFESGHDAWLKTQIATLRVANDRLSREISQQDPDSGSAHRLLEMRERLNDIRELIPEGDSLAREEMTATFAFIAQELAELGVASPIDEHEVRLRHLTNRRIPLDDVLNQQDPK